MDTHTPSPEEDWHELPTMSLIVSVCLYLRVLLWLVPTVRNTGAGGAYKWNLIDNLIRLTTNIFKHETGVPHNAFQMIRLYRSLLYRDK